MITVELLWLYAILASPVMPECVKVESPMIATAAPAFSSFERLVVAMQRRDAGAHARRHIDRAQRRSRAQRITADVSHDRHLVLVQRIEHAAVRAACAHDRRTHRDRQASICTGGGRFRRRSAALAR